MRIWPDHGGTLDLRCDDCRWSQDVTMVEPPYDLTAITRIAQAHMLSEHPRLEHPIEVWGVGITSISGETK